MPTKSHFTPRSEDDEAAVEQCKQLLLATETEKLLTYGAIAKQFKLRDEDVGSQFGPLQAALRALKKESVYFRNEPGLGYVRLDNAGGLAVRVRGRRKKHGKAVRVTVREWQDVDESKLDRTARVAHWAEGASLTDASVVLHGNSVRARSKRYANTNKKEPSLLLAERRRMDAASKKRRPLKPGVDY